VTTVRTVDVTRIRN